MKATEAILIGGAGIVGLVAIVLSRFMGGISSSGYEKAPYSGPDWTEQGVKWTYPEEKITFEPPKPGLVETPLQTWGPFVPSQELFGKTIPGPEMSSAEIAWQTYLEQLEEYQIKAADYAAAGKPPPRFSYQTASFTIKIPDLSMPIAWVEGYPSN